jgi:hypothetical protein
MGASIGKYADGKRVGHPPFYNSTYNGLPVTTNQGTMTGGTSQAQIFILTHEVGHMTNVLQPDFNNQQKSDQNDSLIVKHCKKTIKAAKQ